MKYYLLFFLIPFLAAAQLKSPYEYLGYELGEQFSRHHQVVDYYSYLTRESEKVRSKEYGRTYENRPLILAFVSTPQNLDNLETIRTDNLKRAGIIEGTPETEIAIVWLSYNVHGNESSATEASMATIYELVREGSDKSDWLENTLVIIDPCINPDGRERYVNFYWQYGNSPYNPDPNSLEHLEEWPGGRANHYMFDLNRDWAWQTQIETQKRIKEYNEWLPQIHVDFHEQGINSPYYFAPAAQPFHELITPFQRDFQVEIGKNHAKYFDENNWFYFTKQLFDLLYPSYGDTYPTYNGAIGMTYEQAGLGRAGLGVIKQEGDTLTLKDRIAHHHTTGLSTIEITSKNAGRLLDQFDQFFGNYSGLKYKTFVLKYDGNDDKFRSIRKWLDNNGIAYTSANQSKLKGYEYSTGNNAAFSIQKEDLVISMDQPKATLAHILFEPKTKLVDSITYDITAWGVPYAYGLQAYASTQMIASTSLDEVVTEPIVAPDKAYAFVNKWDSMDDARFLADLLKNGIDVRFTEKRMVSENKRFERGSLIIAKRDNQSIKEFEETIINSANKYARKPMVIQSGFMDEGPDVGSSDVKYLKKPKVALIGYEGTSSLSFGAAWHFMEQELRYPVTVLGTHYFSEVNLNDYDVLIMPNGRYDEFGEDEMQKIAYWVSEGGKLIAIQGALDMWKDSDYSSLKSYVNDEAQSEADKESEERKKRKRLVSYDERERDFMKENTPGAIYKVKLDSTHPLAFGYSNTYYSLKTTSSQVAYLDANNVGVIDSEENLLSGFSGQYAKEDVAETLVFGVENMGEGQIIYFVDDPLFRSFWQNGKLLVVNAIFFVGQ
ncbi:MAG: M14 family zinc carboxypeptidase [Bacteroidota bacterium]